MRFIRRKVAEDRVVRIGLALLTLFAAITPSAFATDKPVMPQSLPATVAAYLALPSAPGNQMLLQRKGNKQYLYIQQASKQGYMIVDVTKATQPNVLKRTAPANQATAGNLEIVGPDVAIARADRADGETCRDRCAGRRC